MAEAALYILTGIALYAGAHHLYLAVEQDDGLQHAPLGVMYLLLSGFALASALTYQVQDVGQLRAAGKASISLGILLWTALLWYVAHRTRFRPLLLLDLLSAAWMVLLIRNISSENSLLYADMPSVSEVLQQHAVSPWWSGLEGAVAASLVFAFYATSRLFRHGRRRAAIALGSGLFLLMLTAFADHLVNSGRLQGAYLAPFGFLAFLLANSLYLVLRRQRQRPSSEAPSVVYNLTFNPEQASFHTDVSQLRTPAGVEIPAAAAPRSPDTAAPPFSADEEVEDVTPVEAVEKGEPSGSTPKPEDDDSKQDSGNKALPALDAERLHIITDNLIDIAVYATMALNRFKRGDADPETLQTLCRKVRTQAIHTRHLLTRLGRNEDSRGL
ncbi:MAG TPA: hypothetical protein ENK05_03005 [Gammaproteobacteria bacterium]|nr:hypothetical protein [Gammaproteobacteria bacterium]